MKIAFITGTNRGLGKALSVVYQEAGWEVVGLSRPAIDLSKLDMNEVTRLLKRPTDKAVFINNAATLLISQDFTAEEVETELRVNLVSPIQIILRFLALHPKGSVINITSGAARNGYPYFGLYCTAKAGMEGFIKSLRSRGVNCLNFDPGVVDTDMQASLRREWPGAHEFQKLRLRDPMDVAMEVLMST